MADTPCAETSLSFLITQVSGINSVSYKNVTQEYHANKKLKESNLFCVLTSCGTQPVSKRARVNTRSEFIYADPILPKHHTHQVYQITTARDMGRFLEDIENKPRSYLIYGLPNKDLIPGDRVLRRKVNFRDRKTKWLIIDFDNVLPPSWTNTTPPQKTFSMLWQSLSTIPGISKEMPPAVWQLSNSWGDSNKEVPKAHAYIELDNPISVARLRSWAAHCRDTIGVDIDKAIYQRTQPIYTARPTLIGGNRAHELNEIQRVFTKAKGSRLIASELILNLPEARDAQIPIEREGDSEVFEYVLSRLEDEGLVRQARPGGKIDILCPLQAQHSGGENDTSTTIWAPTDGKGPSFYCQHTNSHPDGKNGWQWFLSELTDQSIIKKDRLHKISQESAKSEFVSKEHISNWSIIDIQNNYIYIKQSGEVYSIADESMYTMESFGTLHQQVWESREAKQAGDKPRKAKSALMIANSKFPGCKEVISERFDPGSVGLISDGKFLNSYRKLKLKAIQGKTTAFHKHIALICPQAEEAEALTDFIAHIVQRPWERPTWSPVHVSVIQGLGRGLLNSLIRDILSPYTSVPSTKDIFDSQFNDYLKNTLWIGVEETSVHAAKGVSSRLKNLMTVTHTDINGKNKRILYNYPVYARFFFMTNELDALPIDTSDRRFWVIGPTEPGYGPKSTTYYDKMGRLFNNKQFQAAVLYDLQNRDISKFTPFSIPFDTGLKDEMQMATRTSAEKALNHVIKCKHFPPFMESVKIKKLIIDYLNHYNMFASETQINQVLKNLPMWADNKRIKIDGKICRFRILYNRNKYKRYTNEDVRKVLAKQKEIPMNWFEG